jgi:anti-anti-sigma factor
VYAPSLLDVDLLPDRERVVVRAAGELDVATAELLSNRIEELWSNGWTDVLLDLRHVTFMDTAGVHVLLNHGARADQAGLSFGIIDGSPAVSRILALTGADALLSYAAPDQVR